MNAVKVSLNPPFQEDAGHHSPEQMLSALVDGEVDDDQLAALFAPDQGAEDVLEKWHTYQLIGHVLRGDTAASEMTCRPGDFLAGVRGRLQTETMPVVPSQPRSVAARAPAANDAVFRWQLVAGMASLAAVMAVSWSVLSSAPGGPGAVDPQLAVAPASAPVVATPPSPAVQPSTTVVVNTGQGPLIRDARLEELLAEHRQNGGMSALQMPTGFIRSATYDAAGR